MSTGMMNRRLGAGAGLDVLEGPRDSEGMSRVREEYGKLKDVVKTLNNKVSGVLAKQESEFLAAYRSHMYNVQKDLAALRQKVLEAEMALQKNEKVQKLEEDCEWYRSEAIRLDGFATAMKKDLKYMKDKLEVLEEERTWYAKQLKTSKRQTRLLLAELDAKRAAAAGDNLDTKSGTESDPGVAPPFNSLGYSVEHMTKVQPPTLTAGGAYRTGTAPVGTQRPGTTNHATSILYVNNHSLVESGRDLEPRARPGTTVTPTNQWSTPTRHHSAPTFEPATQGHQYQSDPEDWHGEEMHGRDMATQVRQLKRQLAMERKTASQLRGNLVRSQLSRSELESFFMHALEDVKRDIERRRRKAAKERKAGVGAPEEELPTRDVLLDDFTSLDRIKIIFKMLSQDGALDALREGIFSSATGHHVVYEKSTPTGMPRSHTAGSTSPPPARGQRQWTAQESSPAAVIGAARREIGATAGAAAGAHRAEGGREEGLPLQQSTLDYLSGRSMSAGVLPQAP